MLIAALWKLFLFYCPYTVYMHIYIQGGSLLDGATAVMNSKETLKWLHSGWCAPNFMRFDPGKIFTMNQGVTSFIDPPCICMCACMCVLMLFILVSIYCAEASSVVLLASSFGYSRWRGKQRLQWDRIKRQTYPAPASSSTASWPSSTDFEGTDVSKGVHDRHRYPLHLYSYFVVAYSGTQTKKGGGGGPLISPPQSVCWSRLVSLSANEFISKELICRFSLPP